MDAAARPRSVDRLVSQLSRLLPLAAAIRRAVLGLALVALGSGVVIAWVLLRADPPASQAAWLAAAIVFGVLAAPGAILLIFSRALTELLDLPERLRGLPGTGREHASELGRLVGEARQPRRTAARSLPGLLWRFGRLTRSSRDVLGIYAPLAALARLPFLTLVALAAAAAVLEALIAVVLVLAVGVR